MKTGISGMTVVDLFSGGGGLTLGFSQAGFSVAASFENWSAAIEFHKMNFSHPSVQCDLSDVPAAVEAIRPFHPDIIVGGPPCQDFSSAGKRDEGGGRADLTLCFAKIIDVIQPLYFVMENVDRALASKTFAAARKCFKEAGYGVTVQVLDASLCGVPQARKRLFAIGVLGGQDDAMRPFLERNLSARPMTVRDHLGESLGIDHYYRHPRSYKRRGVFSVDEPSPTIRGVNRPLPEGYPGHSGDTVNAKSGVRPLTTRERAMIQTFPADFILHGSKTEVEQIIGNAVPVKLGEYVSRALKEFILSLTSNTTD